MRWLNLHRAALADALRRLLRQPFAGLFTALALGVVLTLPAGLYLGLNHLQRLAATLPAQPEISVFLDPQLPGAKGRALEPRLRALPGVSGLRFVPRDDALRALSQRQGLDDLTAGLDKNPLPDAWIVSMDTPSPQVLTRLAEDLRALPGVAHVQSDAAWAEKLHTGLLLGQRLLWILGLLLASALVAISASAIRALVLARSAEIEVSRLIGASDAYVRRPFLYAGALQGLGGALAALACVQVSGRLLQAPAERLVSLYNLGVDMPGLTLQEQLVLILLVMALSWLGAWIAVGRALRNQP
jgi:cell division transport system permease protein